MTAHELHLFGVTSDNAISHAEPTFENSTVRSISSSQTVVLANRELAADVIQQAIAEFETSAADVGVIPLSADLNYVWSQMPLAIAALSMPLTDRAAIVVRPSINLADELCEVASPVWDLVIRRSQHDPQSVILLPNESIGQDLADENGGRLPEVAPQRPGNNSKWLAAHLRGLQLNRLLKNDSAFDTEVTALHAGLWQLHDFLDESHSHSQSVEGEGSGNGDYWHGIMHRREPDYSNGKYWFRRVGSHACYDNLAEVASRIIASSGVSDPHVLSQRLGVTTAWDASSFIDVCESVAREGDATLTSIAERIQWAEMLTLLVHCYQCTR
jgi:hypothetical protein